MQYTRERAFLTRLWELQAEAGLSDVALATRIGVHQSNISRARREHSQTVSVRFLLAACDTFPELVFLLFPELQTGTGAVHNCTGKGAA